MITFRTDEKQITACEALYQVGATGLVGIGLGAVHLITGHGIPCPMRSLTGWLCPLCGGTHLVEALLRIDIKAAWMANPFVFVVAVLLLVRSVGWIVEAITDRAAVSRRWLPDWWHRHWQVVLVVGSVAFVLVRNLAPLV